MISNVIVIAARIIFVALLIVLSLSLLAPAESAMGHSRLTPWDKADHAIAFYALTLSGIIGFMRISIIWMITGLLVFAFATEILQSFVGRQFSFGDIAADLFGVAAAVLPISLYHFLARERR